MATEAQIKAKISDALRAELDAYCGAQRVGHNEWGRMALRELLAECPTLVELLAAAGVDAEALCRPVSRRWTAEDDRDLAEMWSSGWTDAECAGELGRTPDAVRARRRALGLTRKGTGGDAHGYRGANQGTEEVRRGEHEAAAPEAQSTHRQGRSRAS